MSIQEFHMASWFCNSLAIFRKRAISVLIFPIKEEEKNVPPVEKLKSYCIVPKAVTKKSNKTQRTWKHNLRACPTLLLYPRVSGYVQAGLHGLNKGRLILLVYVYWKNSVNLQTAYLFQRGTLVCCRVG